MFLATRTRRRKVCVGLRPAFASSRVRECGVPLRGHGNRGRCAAGSIHSFIQLIHLTTAPLFLHRPAADVYTVPKKAPYSCDASYWLQHE
jgi:hypothetical protein